MVTDNQIQDLANALRYADEMARAVKVKDEGSCNMDAPTIALLGWPISAIRKASEISGVRIGDKIQSKLWRNDRWLYTKQSGAAYLNTAMAEAAVKALRERGYQASVFYRLD